MGKTLQSFIHDGIHLRLNKRVTPRPAKLIGHRLDIGETAPFRRQKTHRVPRCGMRENMVHQPDALHRAQRFIVDADSPRVINQRLEFFDNQYADAHLTKVVGHHQADRARAGDRDLGGMLYSGLNIRIRCCHFRTSRLRHRACIAN